MRCAPRHPRALALAALLVTLASPARAGNSDPLAQIQHIAQSSMEQAWFTFVDEGHHVGRADILFAETGSWSRPEAGFGMGSDVDATCRGCTAAEARRIQNLYDEYVDEALRTSKITPDSEIGRYFARKDRNVYDGTVDRLKRYQQADPGRTMDQVRREAGDAYTAAYRSGADCTQVSGAESERWINRYTGEKGRVYTADRGAEPLTGRAAVDKLDELGGRFNPGSQGTAAASFFEQQNERFHDPPTRVGEGYGTHPNEARVQAAAKAGHRLDTLDGYNDVSPNQGVTASLADRALDGTPSQELLGKRRRITRLESRKVARGSTTRSRVTWRSSSGSHGTSHHHRRRQTGWTCPTRTTAGTRTPRTPAVRAAPATPAPAM